MNIYRLTDYGVRADSGHDETAEIQKVLDMCKEGGGRVIVPAGVYNISSLRMYSDTTLVLENGALLLGSRECDDYEVYEIPEGVELRTDMEMIPEYYDSKPWDTYRRAMISVYGGRNISIIGEGKAAIDGQDCYDPNGEEGFRGPHIIFITNVDGVYLEGYTAKNGGNFMHQIDNCKNVTLKNVTCLGGSDAVHLHCCEHILIDSCTFHTGDDCIAGINMSDLHVVNCDLNTSCQLFRIGGSHFLIENCYMWGPGVYPHRKTVVRGKNDVLPQNEGRHNLLSVVIYFASPSHPAGDSRDIVFKDCTIKNADRVLDYIADGGPLMTGAYLSELEFDNVRFLNLLGSSVVKASKEHPLTITMRDCGVTFRENAESETAFDGKDPYTVVIDD